MTGLGDRHAPYDVAPHATTDSPCWPLATQGNTEVFWLDLARNMPTRFTFDPAVDALPVWSADGSRILFNSSRSGGSGIYVQGLDGTPAEAIMPSQPGVVKSVCDWSVDGRYILFRLLDPAGSYDLYALPMEPPRTPLPVAHTGSDERDGQFSPDGRWIVYQSDESGRPELYVQPFIGPGQRQRVTNDFGTQARWRADGKELYYINGRNQLVAMSVDLKGTAGLTFGPPSVLFTTHIVGAVGVQRQQYVVAPDGQRFLINTGADDMTGTPITLALNWRPR